jgi:hypothetical protein
MTKFNLGQAASPEYQDEAPPSWFFRADFIRHQLIKQSRESLAINRHHSRFVNFVQDFYGWWIFCCTVVGWNLMVALQYMHHTVNGITTANHG